MIENLRNLPEYGAYDYYITDEEVMHLLKDVDTHCTPRWQLYWHWTTFMGWRSQETLALNITDFPSWKNLDFSKVSYVPQKRKVHVPILRDVPKHLQDFIRDYVLLHEGNFPGGYFFFPSIQTRFKRKYVSAGNVAPVMQKIRKRLINIPGFQEKYGNGIYRIHPHTLRHWWQTRIAKIEKDPYFLQQLLCYSKLETIMHYVKVEDFKEKAPEVLEKAFGGVVNKMNNYSPGQTDLNDY